MPAERPVTPAPAEAADPLQVLRETRAKFVAAFPEQITRIGDLVDRAAARDLRTPIAELRQLVHRMAGLAGTIGFPTVSARASELEEVVDQADQPRFDGARARAMAAAMREAFTLDLSHPPEWTQTGEAPPGGGTLGARA